jgi:hypothetical protein
VRGLHALDVELEAAGRTLIGAKRAGDHDRRLGLQADIADGLW